LDGGSAQLKASTYTEYNTVNADTHRWLEGNSNLRPYYSSGPRPNAP